MINQDEPIPNEEYEAEPDRDVAEQPVPDDQPFNDTAQMLPASVEIDAAHVETLTESGILPVDEVPLFFGTTDDVLTDELDIDAALASVSTLPDIIAEREAAEAAEREHMEAEARAVEEEVQQRASYEFGSPAFITIQRGQMISFIPALTLIAIGAWLTFAYGTDNPPDSGLLALVIGGGLSAVFVAHWLASGRWARGSLFGGLVIFLAGGTVFALSQADDLGSDGWPLLIIVPGIAILLTAFLSQTANARLIFTGIALIVSGLIGLVFSAGTVDTDSLDATGNLWPIVLIIVLVILLLPVLAKRRS